MASGSPAAAPPVGASVAGRASIAARAAAARSVSSASRSACAACQAASRAAASSSRPAERSVSSARRRVAAAADSATRAASSRRTCVGRRGRRRLRRLLGGVGLGLEGLHLACQPIRLGPSLEGRVAAPDTHRERIDHRAPVTGHGEPADGQDGLQLEGRGQVRRPDSTTQQRAHGSVGVPTHGLGQASAGHGRQRVIEPAQLAGRSATGHPVGSREALAHDHVPALAREGGRPSPFHDVRAGEVPQRRLHGRPE